MGKPEDTATAPGSISGPSREASRLDGPVQRPAGQPPALAPGDCLGRYTVLRFLGAGGMGEVYAARDPELDRVIALKVLPAGLAGASPEARARFQREAQALARLSHPNVVAVHDVRVVGEQVHAAMEFVDGPTLAEWLGGAPRPWRKVVQVFLEAGLGLAAAHRAGLVHRDFKPSNVILGERVRVVDFGLARAIPEATGDAAPVVTTLHAEITQAGAAPGTPAYMAPEQREGGAVTPLSDQYAFAVALHEALYGRRPGEPPAPGVRVPRALQALLQRALAVDPAARYPSMPALLQRPRARPPSAAAESGSRPAPRRRSRSPCRWCCGAAPIPAHPPPGCGTRRAATRSARTSPRSIPPRAGRASPPPTRG